MESIDTLLEVLEEKAVKRKCVLSKIINTIDTVTFEIFINNMGAIFSKQISSSDLIVLTKADDFSADRLNGIKRTLKELNKSAEIVRGVIYDDRNMDPDTVKNVSPGSNRALKKIKLEDKLLYIFVGLVALYLLFTVSRSIDFSSVNIDLSWLQALNTVFLSILMQAFPFILIGVFVSSILQVIISDETLVKIFPRRRGLGFIVAILAGVMFPVCDCAIVPVAARLIKKGVPRKKVNILSYMFFIIPLIMAFSLPAKDISSSSMSFGGMGVVEQANGTYSDDASNIGYSDSSNAFDDSSEDVLADNASSASSDQSTDTAFMDEDEAGDSSLELQGDTVVMDDDNFVKWMQEIYDNPSKYEGKKVEVTGFVFKDKQFKSNEFVAARLMMVCCAADLTTVGLLAHYNNASELKQDSWFKFSGKIVNGEFKGQQMPIIDIENVEKTEKPENEYVYPY